MRKQTVRLTSNWSKEIQEKWGIKVLEQMKDVLETALWTTRCSKTKNGVHCGIPKELYVSPINMYFYRCMDKYNLRYGVLSDKYGLHYDNEELLYYDVHPSHLNDEDKKRLGLCIRDKAKAHGFFHIIFYSPSPLMSIPYFEMLYYSELNIFYTTKLNLKVAGALREAHTSQSEI